MKVRATVVSALLVCAWIASGAGASAPEPPAHDQVEDATVIAALPFTDDVDVSGATTTHGEPVGCYPEAGNSVWYRFSPAEDVKVDLSTRQSHYDTTVELFEVARGDEPLDCDDNGSSSGTESRLQAEMRAGSSYLLRVSEASGDIRPDQHLRLSVRQYEPFSYEPRFYPVGQVFPSGEVYLRQSAQCNDESESSMLLTLTQGAGALRVEDTQHLSPGYCSPGPDSLSRRLDPDGYGTSTVEPETGGFLPGPATIQFVARSCSYGRYAECVDVSREHQVVLRPRSNDTP